jgi:purine-nucleoside phosphorylase
MRIDVSERDVAAVREVSDITPRVGVVLGSVSSALADSLEHRVDLPYGSLPDAPRPEGVVPGHEGVLTVGELRGVPVVFFSGRFHVYQALSALDAAYTSRLAHGLGATTMVLTNASGGLCPSFVQGDLMLIDDHLNLMGTSPLEGWPGEGAGGPFVPMSQPYDPELAGIAWEVAEEKHVPMKAGVYAGLRGPAYETPAEVRMLQALGADAVGMSTVPETIAARALGMRVMGISLITNVAAHSHISHEEVLATAKSSADLLSELLLGILVRL